MLPAGIGVVACREIVKELNIGHQAAASVIALDEVVAENVILGKRAASGCRESIDIVNALADEAAGAEEVLVDIRHGGGVRINAG